MIILEWTMEDGYHVSRAKGVRFQIQSAASDGSQWSVECWGGGSKLAHEYHPTLDAAKAVCQATPGLRDGWMF